MVKMKRIIAVWLVSILLMGGMMWNIGVNTGAGKVNTESTSTTSTINPIWNRTWGGAHNEWGNGVAVDSAGYIYTTGNTESYGTVGYRDVFLLKHDRNGNLIWSETWGKNGSDDDANGVAVDTTTGCIYITGGTVGYGGYWGDVCLLKYDKDGHLIWSKTWGGSNDDWANSIAIGLGYIYITGGTESYGAGWCDVCLLKYDVDGNLIWSKTWGGADADCGMGIAVDSDGYIYITGRTSYTSNGYNPTDHSNLFLLKYSGDGNLIWSKTWGGNESYVEALCVAVDSSGYIYTAGYTKNDDANWEDILLLKYDQNGNLIWNKTWCGNGTSDYAYGVAAYFGYIYTVGVMGGSAILLKYDYDGNLVWSKTWKGSGSAGARDLAIYSGYIYVAGTTRSYGDKPDAFLFEYGLNGGGGEEGGLIGKISELPWLYIIIPIVIITVLAGVGLGIKCRKRGMSEQPVQAPMQPQQHPGPYCGHPLGFIQQYNRWYCDNCKRYM